VPDLDTAVCGGLHWQFGLLFLTTTEESRVETRVGNNPLFFEFKRNFINVSTGFRFVSPS
jgi:hypothetical protein